METIINLSAISKKFANRSVLKGISFSVKRGESLALLGPNGAGKSTLLSILQGLRRANEGNADVFGHKTGSSAAMAKVGVTPQDADFPPQMTPRELLGFAGAHFSDPEHVGSLVTAFGLEKLVDRRTGGFSGGERRRVALALAFAGRPELVFLDEPTTGLDTGSQAMFNRYASMFIANGGTLILTSHNLHEVFEYVCDRIVMIDDGEIVADGPISAIRDAVGARQIRFRLDDSSQCPDERFQRDNGYWCGVISDVEPTLRRILHDNQSASNLTVENLPLDEAIALHRAADAH